MRFRSLNDATSVTVRDRATGQAAAIQDGPAEPTYDDGRRDGYRACVDELQPRLDTLQQRIRELDSELPAAVNAVVRELQGQAEGAIIDTALALAEVIVKREIAREPSLEAALRLALAEVPRWQHRQLLLPPDEAQRFTAAGLDQALGLTVLPDASLAPGDLIIHSPDGSLDGRLDARLAELKQCLQLHLRSGETPDA